MSGQPGKVGEPPEHYKSKTGLQPFDVIDAFELNFYIGTALRYLLRYKKKDDPVGDLKKAIHYLEEEIIRIS